MSKRMVINYPLFPEWTTAEVITVTNFYALVEQYYERGVNREDFLVAYAAFRRVEPTIMAQKQLDRAFQQETGYSIYRAVKDAQQQTAKRIRYRG